MSGDEWQYIGHTGPDFGDSDGGKVWTAPAGTPPPRGQGAAVVYRPGSKHPHVEQLPPTYQQQPHAYVDSIAAAALHADIDPDALNWSGTYRAARSNLTVEVVNPVFDLIMYGRSRAAHDLLRRLNMRWKYRLNPGVPERARRALGGDPELHATPVIVEVDGRRIEALAEHGFDTVKLYPAHPKGTRTK